MSPVRWSALASLLVSGCHGGMPQGGGGSDDASGGIVIGGSTGASGSGHADGEGDGDGDGADDSGEHHIPRFDLPSPDAPMGCGGDEPGNSFSIIWIANSSEGTVSKIDTLTAVELARYRTGAGSADPSRTAVNLGGDVAVSNRYEGTVVKIAGSLERCVDADGDGQITTSTGPADVLDWGSDECVLWVHDTGFDASFTGSNQGGPRATAWIGGELDPATCQSVGADLWVSWRNQPDTSATIRKLDGETGVALGEAVIPDWPDNWGHGPYGGAADATGDLWALGTSGSMFRVDGDDFSVDRWDNPVSHVMYGVALDQDGAPWVAGWSGNLWHFDRVSETWIDKGGATGGPTRLRGLAVDRNGEAWIAGNNPCALVRYDTAGDTLVNAAIALPDCVTPVGVSIDVDGMVWVVDKDADRAFKVDPSDNTVVTVTGLVDPYTYSDMTGAGLGLVAHPPG